MDTFYNTKFELHAGLSRRYFWSQADAVCDLMKVAGGEEMLSQCPVFRHQSGDLMGDLIGTGYAYLNLASNKFVEALKAHSFSGWSTFPIKLFDKFGGEISGYSGLAVTGRCGFIDWNQGREELRPPPSSRGRPYSVWVGMYFDQASWDGSDLFRPHGSGYVIATEAVKVAIERVSLKNVCFTRLTEFERTWSTVDIAQ